MGKIDHILVDRLYEFLPWALSDHDSDEQFLNEIRFIDLSETSTSIEYLPEDDRDKDYDLGRIRWFVDNGIPDPILMDNQCSGGRIYPVPVIIDGWHRYVAAVLRGDRKIPVFYSGRVDLLRWLKGLRKTRPE